MLSSYQCLPNKQKLAILRAFFVLKNRDEFEPLLDFLADVEQMLSVNLRELPLDKISKEQGKAQMIADLRLLISSAKAAEIERLKN